MSRASVSFALRWCDRDGRSFSYLWAVRGRVTRR